jgi:hypothetical protein
MDSPAPADLSDLKAQLDSWRQSHRKRSRIPDHFYQAAVSLLDRYSVSTICRETRLRPASLRHHAQQSRKTSPPQSPAPTSFLQLQMADFLPGSAPQLPAQGSFRLQVERVDGTRLTLSVPTLDSPTINSLVANFLHG